VKFPLLVENSRQPWQLAAPPTAAWLLLLLVLLKLAAAQPLQENQPPLAMAELLNDRQSEHLK